MGSKRIEQAMSELLAAREALMEAEKDGDAAAITAARKKVRRRRAALDKLTEEAQGSLDKATREAQGPRKTHVTH